MEAEVTTSYEDLLERFKHLLKLSGLKYTQQREAILRTIYESEGHFTPEMLHQQVQQLFSDQKIGIATIYRTLSLLESEHIVTSISFGVSGKKYEFGMKQHHDHMICDKCGKMIEFVDETIEKRQAAIAKNHNFIITGHTLQIHGICEECQKEKKR
ncbi:MAG: Fur family transcriptional regulator [Campylobacterales bacterium]